MAVVVGIDFGTTNSVVAVRQPDGRVTTARFAFGAAEVDVFRSLLCFWSEEGRGRSILHHAAGPAAIRAYLDDPLDSRLIMSMKTYLAQRSFSQTRVFNRPFTLEQLVGGFLRALFAATPHLAAEARIVAGRPVHFAGETADDALGEARLRGSYAEAGHPDIAVALEPEAAGYRFGRTLEHPTTVLVGDFGGGTSDFSVLRFEPGSARRVTALGHAGIGIAGDTFDYRIIDHVIAPRLGKGDTYKVLNHHLPVPPEYYGNFARWHRLSLMRTPRMLRELEEVARACAHPERLRTLITLINDELGYQLYQSVSEAKAALSRSAAVTLRFRHKEFALAETISRADFESWIAQDLDRISATVDKALHAAGLGDRQIDRVFLTGGTSFIPAIRALFEARFGPDIASGGGEFVAVAEGLALLGADLPG
jgi:hypothetical chaperone protein